MIYFIADMHIGHSSIIKLCNRPFSSIEEMNEKLIENWNKKVHKNDTVYILGDMFYCKKNESIDYGIVLDRLKGNKVLIVGNHDESWLTNELKNKFTIVSPLLNTYLNQKPVTLCHYPLLEWKGSHKIGSKKLGFQIFGHIHNKVKPEYEFLFSRDNCLNAGVDINNFEPVTFEELIENNKCFREDILKIR